MLQKEKTKKKKSNKTSRKNVAKTTENNPSPNNLSSRKQIHHGEFHNQPDPPADLNLQPPAITKAGIGVKWPNHNLIGSSIITSNAKHNLLDTISLIRSPISIDEISSQNTRLFDWITCNMNRIQNFSNRNVNKISWNFFRTYPSCDKFKLNKECFNLLSDAALECLDILTDNLSSPINFTTYKSKISSWLFNGSSRNTKVITNQIHIAKYARIINPSIDKLQKAGISQEINTKRIELAARRIKTACLTTHTSKTSTELLLGCFFGQLRLAKITNHGLAKPCQICHTFESYTIKTNTIFNTFYSCPLATFKIQICELYSITILGHRIQINLNGMILLKFFKKILLKQLRIKKRVFYTILSIAKSTLFFLSTITAWVK